MKTTTVMGCFDYVRRGHLQFLYEASKSGDLHILLAPDFVVEKLQKQNPVFSQEERRDFLYQIPFVKEVHIDCYQWGLNSLIQINPDSFYFGVPESYKSEKIIEKVIQEYCLKTEIGRISKEFESPRSSDFRNGVSKEELISKQNVNLSELLSSLLR